MSHARSMVGGKFLANGIASKAETQITPIAIIVVRGGILRGDSATPSHSEPIAKGKRATLGFVA